jgi:hypothetical protein
MHACVPLGYKQYSHLTPFSLHRPHPSTNPSTRPSTRVALTPAAVPAPGTRPHPLCPARPPSSTPVHTLTVPQVGLLGLQVVVTRPLKCEQKGGGVT